MTIPLQKSVCIKCINNHPTEPNPWDEIDEDKWEQEGTVCCPGNIGKDDTSIYFIPTSCPYEITHKEGKIKPIPISESVCKQCYQKYGIPWKNDLDKPRKYKEDCPAIRRAFCDSDLDGYDWSQFPTNCPYALEHLTQ